MKKCWVSHSDLLCGSFGGASDGKLKGVGPGEGYELGVS